MPYKFHIDPGHGWLEVPYSQLVEFGVQTKISGCSYRDKGTCYLEEDCDAGVFIQAWEYHYGKKMTFTEVAYDFHNSPPCFIRELPSYHFSPDSLPITSQEFAEANKPCNVS